MPTYISLLKFTDQGIRSIKDSPKRAEAFRSLCEKLGGRVKDLYWTMGRYDIVTIVEAPDDGTINAILYSVASLGNARTETLKASTAQEMNQAIARMA